MIPKNITFKVTTGSDVNEIIDDLAQLRITVFHDFPYLYEGSYAYEKEYLKIYSNSRKSFIFSVYDAGKMVGASTCIPLADETEEVQNPFREAFIDVDTVFYFGESILLPAYRGAGLGHRFFDEREAHAASFNTFSLTAFCAVERSEAHPAKPDAYRPNDVFWLKRGYTKNENLQALMEWPDLGEAESSTKKMIFWTRPLNGSQLRMR
jgi:GNAT superfamily N-acetyltransferase